MPAAGDISEDRGFKTVFSLYPLDTLEVVAPHLLKARGTPSSVRPLPQETPLPDLGQPSRFLDMALMARWADGGEAVIALIEHWSAARKVDLRRVNWYVADLACRHRDAAVWPVVLVTEASCAPIPNRWRMTVAGRLVAQLRVRVMRVTAADLPWLRRLQRRNAVAAVLRILVRQDPVEDLAEAILALSQRHGELEDLRRLIPFMLMLARIPAQDGQRLRRRLQDLPHMSSILDQWLNEAKSEGRAEGKAEGELDAIRRLIARRMISADAACAAVRELREQGIVTADQARSLLAELER
jgi:hypothetical protein